MSYALPMPTPVQPSAPRSGARMIATGGRVLPLRHAHLDAEAGGGLCRVVLTQRFVNPHPEPLHVTYLLPLPADGAVSGFSFTLGERRIVGEIDGRQQARERFEAAVAEGRTAALVEQDRSNLFTQEVGNIPPGEEILCEIVIDQPLRWLEEGRWEWRFPTVVGPRYMGAAGAVPDASKITVPVASHGTGARSSLALRLGDALAGAVESPSHQARAKVNDASVDVRFDGASLDRDVVIRWPVATDEPGVALRAARPADPRHHGRTYGLVTVTPPKAAPARQARDLVLLLDTSGSMGGRPLDQLKRIALALLDSLASEDRLEMISFGNRPERFQRAPLLATRDGKAAARRWIQKLRASGGTEMHSAVLEALRPLRPDAQRQVILMTDGFIGFEQRIVAELLDRLPPNARLHTVGVGSAPNRSLTQAAARAGGGAELIVGLEEDAERAAARLLARTAAPLVTELSIEGAVRHAPRRLPDLYAGCPALISLELGDAREIVLRGAGVDGPFERRLEITPLDLGEGEVGIATRFGRERVEDLEMELTAGGERARIDEDIEHVAVRFQIASRLTSWIAVTEEVTVRAPARREDMPHELPHGVSAESFGLRPAIESQDHALIDQLEARRGAPFGEAQRGRLLEQAAELRADGGEKTQTGTLKGNELEQLLMGSLGGAAALEADDLETLTFAADELARPISEDAGDALLAGADGERAEPPRKREKRGRAAPRVQGRAAPTEPAPLAPSAAPKGRVPPAAGRAHPSLAAPPRPESAGIAPTKRPPGARAALLWFALLLLLALLLGGLTWWLRADAADAPEAPPRSSEVEPGG